MWCFRSANTFFRKPGILVNGMRTALKSLIFRLSLRKIKHPVFTVVPVICLECHPHSPVDTVPEYLVAPDRVESARGDVPGFRTVHEGCCQGTEQGIELPGTQNLVRDKLCMTPAVVCPGCKCLFQVRDLVERTGDHKTNLFALETRGMPFEKTPVEKLLPYR